MADRKTRAEETGMESREAESRGVGMQALTQTVIRKQVASSEVVFSRGENLFLLGNYSLMECDEEAETYHYAFDGN